MTSGTATDAANFKPGDKVRITIDRTINEDGGVFLLGGNHLPTELTAWGDTTVTQIITCTETCICDPVTCDVLDSKEDTCSDGCAVCIYGCPLGDGCPLDVPWSESFAAHRPATSTGRTDPA